MLKCNKMEGQVYTQIHTRVIWSGGGWVLYRRHINTPVFYYMYTHTHIRIHTFHSS